MPEGEYLTSVVINDKDNKFALLDKKFIQPEGARNWLEFCDLLYQLPNNCKAFIHVKNYHGSSSLSHLFAQASVATESLMNDTMSVRKQVNKHLKDMGKSDFNIRSNNKDSLKKYKVVLAIMRKSTDELQLPFFSKVNLRRHVRIINNMGFTVELVKIYKGE